MPLGRRLANVLKVLAVFLLLGPPIGGLTLFVGLGAHGASQTGDLGALLWVALFGLIYAVPLSYLVGILPAAIAGLILGATAVLHRPPGTLLATATGIAVGLGLVYSGGRPIVPLSAESATEYVPAALLVSSCLVATILCWAAARRTLRGSS